MLRIDSRKLQILGVKLERRGVRGGGVTPRQCRGEGDEADEEEGRGKMLREEGRSGGAEGGAGEGFYYLPI